MSIEVSTNRNTGERRISIKRPDGSSVGTITIRSQSLKKLKKLGYKQRRISTMITQATTSGNARQVLASAKTETVNLRRKLVSGKYNDREVRAAIRHAERMERVAKKRMKHLQQEEYIEKHGGGTWPAGIEEENREESGGMEACDFAELSAEEMKQLMQELQEEMEQLAQENEMEELMQTMYLDMDPAELEQLKKKHRADEMREIVEADMKYLRALFSQMEKERQDAASPLSSDSGVSLQLAGVEIPVQVDTRSAAEVASASAPPAGGTIDVSL